MKTIKKSPVKRSLSTADKHLLARVFTQTYMSSPQFQRELDAKAHIRSHNFSKSLHRSLANVRHAAIEKQQAYREALSQSAFAHRLAAVSAVLAFVVVAQLAYPNDRALPLTRLQSQGFVGFSSQETVLANFQDFDSRTLTVHTHNKNLTTSYRDLGVTLRPDDTVKSLSSYSRNQRLIPFSFLIVGNKNVPVSRELNEAQLELFVKDVVAQADKKPVDAVVLKSGTTLSVNPSEDGYEYKLTELKSQVLRSDLRAGAQMVFAPTVLYPAISTELAQGEVGRMQSRINNPITLNAEGKIMTISSETIASWIDIIPKPSQKQLELSFNKQRIADSIRSFPSQIDYPSTAAVSTLLNGLPAGKTEGAVGKSLQFEELVNRIASTTSAATSNIEAPVTTLFPKEVVDRKYSRDSAGLQNLLSYWTENHRGQYSIDLRAVNGKIEANTNPYRLFPGVGIYRIYIAHMVYGRISAKSLAGNSMTQAGFTVDVCLDKMMRDSDEACTNALGTIIGWSASDDLLRAQGFDSTTLAQGASITTANDTADWMTKLLAGGISSRAQADSLTSMMSRSSVRGGIPAGSKGIQVANKSGGFGRTIHDIGIVYHPKGTYVLSVLSEGSSLSLIADLTAEINKVMNQ